MTRGWRKRAIPPKEKFFAICPRVILPSIHSLSLFIFEHMVFDSETAHNYVEFLYGRPQPKRFQNPSPILYLSLITKQKRKWISVDTNRKARVTGRMRDWMVFPIHPIPSLLNTPFFVDVIRGSVPFFLLLLIP